MKIIPSLLFLIISFNILSQNYVSEKDTITDYLIDKCFEMVKPHSDLTFSFGSEELINIKPNLNVNIITLNDTVKYLAELTGKYQDWRIFYKIGKLYQKHYQHNNAMNYYNQAYNIIYSEILKDSLNAGPMADLGWLYFNLGNNQDAYHFYKKAYLLNPDDSASSNFYTMFSIFNGDFNTAETIISTILKTDPQNIEMQIWQLTSMIYKTLNTLNREDKSLKEKPIDQIFDFNQLNTFSTLYKNDIRFQLLELLGKQMALMAKYSFIDSNFIQSEISKTDDLEIKKIQNQLNKILSDKGFKNEYILFKSIGFNFLLQKQFKKAVDYFIKSIACWPADKNSKDYYILFTTHYFILNDTLSAIKVLQEKIKSDSVINNSNPYDYVLLGNVYLTRNEMLSAKQAYNKSLTFSENQDAYLGLAIIEINKMKLAEANVFINKAYDLNNDNYKIYALFGFLTLLNDQKQSAKEALAKALQLMPDDKTVREVYQYFFP